MSNRRKKIIISGIVVAAVLLVVLVLLPHILNEWDLRHVTEERAQKVFDQHRDEFELIRDYLFDLNLDAGFSYYGGKDETVLLTWVNKESQRVMQMEIKNESVQDAYKSLYKAGNGFCLISQEGTTVRFDIWSGFTEITAGIAYVSDGTQPNVPYLTESHPLNEQNWYFYKSDYNLWRVLNETSHSNTSYRVKCWGCLYQAWDWKLSPMLTLNFPNGTQLQPLSSRPSKTR